MINSSPSSNEKGGSVMLEAFKRLPRTQQVTLGIAAALLLLVAVGLSISVDTSPP